MATARVEPTNRRFKGNSADHCAATFATHHNKAALENTHNQRLKDFLVKQRNKAVFADMVRVNPIKILLFG